MPNRLTVLSVSDPRGDMDFVGKAIALAQQKDVNAQGVFFLGNFAGQMLSKTEYLQLDSARRSLQSELKAHDAHYKELGISNVWGLIDQIARSPEKFRRGPEVAASNAYRQLLGRKDLTGKFGEVGAAGKKARGIYGQAAKLFSKSRVPCYLMGDTIFAEELPEAHWLHFSWVSLGGFAIRCLGTGEIDDVDVIPELFLGPRRGGRLIRLEAYPFSSADLIFAYALSPVLHEVLSTHERKLAILCGDGNIDLGYARNVLSTQKHNCAYLYAMDGAKVTRSAYEYRGGTFSQPLVEDGTESTTTTKFRRKGVKRAEIETQVKLAGIGSDLLKLVDLLRIENPDLAAQMEQAENRAEAIYRYIQYLEAQRHQLKGTLAGERAGFERLLGRVSRYFNGAQVAELTAALKARPDATAEVGLQDQANEKIATLVERILGEKFGPPQSSSATLAVLLPPADAPGAAKQPV